MRGMSKMLVLFGIVFLAVGGGILFVTLRMTSGILDSATRPTDPSAVMSTVSNAIVWTVVPIVLITVAGLAVFFFFMRRIMGGNAKLIAGGLSGTALVLSVRDTGVTINNVNAVLEARLQV